MVITKKKLVMAALTAGMTASSICPALAADDTQNGAVKNQLAFAQQALKEIQENSQLVQDLRAKLDQNIAAMDNDDSFSDFPESAWESYANTGDYDGALFQGVLYTLEENELSNASYWYSGYPGSGNSYISSGYATSGDSFVYGRSIINGDVTTNGDFSVNGKLSVGGKTYIDDTGIHANNQRITDVADGIADTDAVNVGQLKTVDAKVDSNTDAITNLSSNVTNLNGRVSSLDTRINRVGAGAAALAALHPQDYDPTAKWDFAAGYGNYKSANAVAIGAFYRPTHDVLFSIGTSMGGGENMFNAGVSFKFGSSNEYSNYSKASLATVVSEQASTIGSLNARVEKQEQENEALRAQVEKQAQENAELRTQVQDILRQLANK